MSHAQRQPEIRMVSGDQPLDRARAAAVERALRAAWPDAGLTIDRLVSAEGEGSTAARLRSMLREGRADLAVQACDALPADEPADLIIAAIPQRADPRDVMVSASGKVLAYQPEGARIGTESGRRAGQMLRRRSDVEILSVDGDAPTRLARLDAGEYDALLFSAADLEHLGLRARVTEYFDHDQMIPAPGQAALALEIRADDRALGELLAPLNDEQSAYAVLAERACMKLLGAEPQDRLGVHAFTDGDRMAIFGIVVSRDGTRTARMQWSGPWRDARDLGETLAELLQSIGGDRILRGEDIPPTVRYAMRPGGNDLTKS